ncbi:MULTISPECIES: hypothetical protein [Pantoea]|uniref:Uncharacterized protein n=1 Tax=Pantoea dispersa TaxID=59814 RepID=A0A8E1S323_9GAMM|nr:MULTISPECIES: hypothetical protein [Pantoea]MBK4771361.1 hypothetical protein [Pantoea sp. Morm]MBK4785738.1 hypothetical protein [Pantoea sp. Pent]ERH62613.1 hypothetical protein N172_07120 [Pantoea dispersa EGD-AAK13]KAA6100404.1 hypothetical protein F3I21_13080 [Pantoea sp. B_9]KAA6110735.1 hypothetical protein F3I18_16980 [Pantoea sp. B_10]
MKHDELEDADEIYLLLGKVVTQIVQPGETLSVQQIIGALYRTGLRSENPAIQQACDNAIRLLAKKLN